MTHDVDPPKHQPRSKALQKEVIPQIVIHGFASLCRVLVGLFVNTFRKILGRLWWFRLGALPEHFKI
jgi:hypothetical protein